MMALVPHEGLLKPHFHFKSTEINTFFPNTHRGMQKCVWFQRQCQQSLGETSSHFQSTISADVDKGNPLGAEEETLYLLT